MPFSNIKGQSQAVKLLKRSVESNRVANTYLFYGPQGIGKKFAAREFAKVLNCTEKPGDSCSYCLSCTKIEQDNHPDISWVCPTGKSRQIKINQVRQLQRFVSMKAYEAKTKVCIIVDAHTLNIEAGNALLKTLEEPPPNSMLILITDSKETLLPTIKSRAQEVQFFYLKQDVIAELLEKKMDFSKKESLLYGQLGMGSIERALDFKKEDVFNQRKFILDIFAKGSFKDMKDLMEKVEEIQDQLARFKEELAFRLSKEGGSETAVDEDAFIAGEYRKKAEEILGLIYCWYRDILVYNNTKNEEIVFNKDYIDRIKYWGEKLDMDKLCARIEIIKDIKMLLARQINLKLLLQVMFVRLGLI